MPNDEPGPSPDNHPAEDTDGGQNAVEAVATALQARSLTLAVAESLTGGLLANRFAVASEASQWFRGGVVSYASEVKFHVLGVTPGPVVTEQAAREMAEGVARALEADVSVAVTGVGGPDEQDGQPPGTVWVAVKGPDGVHAHLYRFAGGPAEVCEQTCAAAVGLLAQSLSVPVPR